MDVTFDLLFLALCVYLIGSIPFGFILTKIFTKQDIRSIGSGHTGTTNVLRSGKKWLAALTLFLDLNKGWYAMHVGEDMMPPPFRAHYFDDTPESILAMFAVIAIATLGHCFPIWLKFKGGKGVIVGLGMLLIIPYTGLAACMSWLGAAIITRYSCVSALIAFLFATFVTFFIYGPPSAAICALITLLIWIRHKDNFKRLFKGEEPKIGQKNNPRQEEDASEPVSK